MGEVDHVLAGDRVALGPLRTDLAETYQGWLHDRTVRAGLATPGIFGIEAEEKWVRETIERCAQLQPEVAAFTIYDLGDGAPVGTSSVFGIEWRMRRATFGIMLGDRRGVGLGTEATRLVLDWAFHVLGLRNVMLEVLPQNRAAIRAYEKAGFRVVGSRRDALISSGQPCDALIMDAVPGDFESPVLARRG